ncbi:MAG TPA: plastocyanin/azurin family copper-binding protein [Gemmatimonadales bacterium]|nr:plastocyanin/azurin family copper-binding protein [Gemmatimonadales bacterium]
MRRLLLTAVAVAAVGCGGEKKADTAPAAPPPAGPVVVVNMTGNGQDKAAFEPSSLTIQSGTTVRFVNASGGPHNIAFSPDSVPQGGADALRKGMPNPLTDLAGPFMTKQDEAYDVSFAGAPRGVYRGVCQPHATLGMTIVITVR